MSRFNNRCGRLSGIRTDDVADPRRDFGASVAVSGRKEHTKSLVKEAIKVLTAHEAMTSEVKGTVSIKPAWEKERPPTEEAILKAIGTLLYNFEVVRENKSVGDVIGILRKLARQSPHESVREVAKDLLRKHREGELRELGENERCPVLERQFGMVEQFDDGFMLEEIG
jgi:hypothetical protein